ncbi:permease-like cell division protein FtsX [Microbispora sp. NPDC049125]|uniref:permease-like cell division protein FtsX n=1 Tax=Microbispora sp. NPDC049125 TaxID=3154929 RepID=UPI003465DBDC
MYGPTETPESEELSFEGPERWSRWAAWVRAHTRLAAAVGASIAVLAVIAGGRLLYERSRQPLPPPEGSSPQTGHLSVYLCATEPFWEKCRGPATAADRRKIEAALRSIPEIQSFRFETREQSLANLRKTVVRASNPEGLPDLFGSLRPEDVPESYYAALRPGDWPGVRQRVEALPGVSYVRTFRDDMWWGKADVAITLCPRASSLEKRCARRGAATEAEKAAVLDRIHSLPGIETVYFEDRTHAVKALGDVSRQGLDANGDLPGLSEVFYLKLDRPVTKDLSPSFSDLPGVAGVRPVSTP